jgi:hypothetical protein
MESISLSQLLGQRKSINPNNNDRPKRMIKMPERLKNTILTVVDDVYSDNKVIQVYVRHDGTVTRELPTKKTREQNILDNNISILTISDKRKDLLKENGIHFLKDFESLKHLLSPNLRKTVQENIKYLLKHQDVITEKESDDDEDELEEEDDEEEEEDELYKEETKKRKREDKDYVPSSEEEEEDDDDEELDEDEEEEEVEEEEDDDDDFVEDDEDEEEDSEYESDEGFEKNTKL